VTTASARTVPYDDTVATEVVPNPDDDMPDLTDEEEDQMLSEWFTGLHIDETVPSFEWPEANED